MTLDTAIRDAARRGVAITIWPLPDDRYQVNVSFDRQRSWTVRHGTDPVATLLEIIGPKNEGIFD